MSYTSHLCSGHGFQLPDGTVPTDERHSYKCDHSSQQTGMVEGIRDTQESCAHNEIEHEEEAQEYVDGADLRRLVHLQREHCRLLGLAASTHRTQRLTHCNAI